MRLLLDTCTFLWLVRGDPSLSPVAHDLIVDPANEALLSVVSAWEIGVKFALGKLSLPVPPGILVPRERRRHALEALPLGEEAALVASGLPPHHRDPFDRLLVGQAIIEGALLLTPDPLVSQYGAFVRW